MARFCTERLTYGTHLQQLFLTDAIGSSKYIRIQLVRFTSNLDVGAVARHRCSQVSERERGLVFESLFKRYFLCRFSCTERLTSGTHQRYPMYNFFSRVALCTTFLIKRSTVLHSPLGQIFQFWAVAGH